MIPERGDILHLNFDPASGKEMLGPHFCLVFSPKAFNARFRLVMVCPISGGAAEAARNNGFLVSLMGYGLRTDGNVHTHQLKTLDWTARKASFVEKVPAALIQEVIDRLLSVLEDE